MSQPHTDTDRLDGRLAGLSPEKRALFEKLLRERAETVLPLSVMQQGIWFLEQLRPNNPAYVIPVAVRVSGRLDRAVLRDAVNAVVRRHESLRTTFELRDGKPAQVVRAVMTLELPEVDLRDAGAAGWTAEELEERVHAELAAPFDLGTGPLLRATLLRIDAEEYVLAVAMHHLISDGWSVAILVGELSACYEAFAAGRTPQLPALAIQYGDFATWQQQWLRRENLGEDLAYWRDHLAGAPGVLALPTDQTRPPVQGFQGASVPVALPEPLIRDLAALGRRHGATPYMVLLAVFQLLLHRYSDSDDVVVGVPMANRGRAEIEPLIGFFVNTLPIRTSLAGDPSFVEVLARVRDACLGAYAHQAVPFETVVGELKPPRDLSRPPIFQVSFSYQSDPLPNLTVAGVRLRRMPLRARGARFDLEWQSFDDNGALSGWFEYDRDLFDEATMRRMVGHLRRLAELVVAAPETPVGELDLLDAPGRQEALAAGTGPERTWPETGWIHQVVEERVRRTPDAVAVRFEGRGITYAELNARANRLAHRLRRLGVGRDVLVGVSLPRGFELVVSLLAVLKAGGAYVALDPGYPRARLEFMLADAAAPVLLTDRNLAEDLGKGPAEAGATVLLVEDLAAELAGESVDNPDVEVRGEDLAYVIYTSGSTGTPKGVLNVHSGIRNRLLWMQDTYRLDHTDRVLQKTPFSFDVSVWEFFWPLMAGATLVVARPDAHKDGGYLVDTIRAEAVTTVHFVPSMLSVILREPGLAGCDSLRRVICSGEALTREHQERFFEQCDAELHNLYGPTEAAIDVTAWQCRPDGDPRGVPIGFPIANTQALVLDRRLRPVPTGVPGQLFLGGDNLARGYHNRPELTAERFIAHPFDPRPAARLYQTGDLARVRSDGAIDYLGRLDHQVKVRGFRIELGEIESVLCQHERVRDAVVVARVHGAGDTRLIAYLAGDGDPTTAPTPGELIGFLRERVPEYLVPAAFVVLAALPLTPNGKVDRAALPAPDLDRPELATPYVAPRDDLERALGQLWCELLGVERVGRHDNFFELGGHSLLIPELKGRITADLGHEVSMVELFQYPTVGSLAEHLNRPASARPDPMRGAHDRAEGRRQSQSQRQLAAQRRERSRNSR
jgi:amino acid adenylation domain-containing protein